MASIHSAWHAKPMTAIGSAVNSQPLITAAPSAVLPIRAMMADLTSATGDRDLRLGGHRATSNKTLKRAWLLCKGRCLVSVSANWGVIAVGCNRFAAHARAISLHATHEDDLNSSSTAAGVQLSITTLADWLTRCLYDPEKHTKLPASNLQLLLVTPSEPATSRCLTSAGA